MEAVIFIGIQGTGKSSFYREQFFHTHVRINSDLLINFNDLPLWQRRGIGLYWQSYQKTGTNPLTQEAV